MAPSSDTFRVILIMTIKLSETNYKPIATSTTNSSQVCYRHVEPLHTLATTLHATLQSVQEEMTSKQLLKVTQNSPLATGREATNHQKVLYRKGGLSLNKHQVFQEFTQIHVYCLKIKRIWSLVQANSKIN